MQNRSEPEEFRVVGRKRSVKKALVVGAYAAAFLAFIAYYAGYFEAGNAERADDQTYSAAANQPAAPVNAPVTVKESLPTKPFVGSVESVRTGDILSVTDDANRTFLVRLAGVTSPKLNEPFGVEAKNSLATRVLNKRVQVTPLSSDDDADLVSDVLVDGTSLSIFQIQNGLATYNENTAASLSDERRQQLALAETTAKNNKYGLWTAPGSPGEEINSAQAESRSLNQAASSMPRRALRDSAGVTLVASDAVGNAAEPTAPQAESVAERPPTTPLTPTVTVPAQPAPAQTTTIAKPDAVPATAASPRKYVLGPRGGCYYLTPGGSKSYVDKSKCN